MAFVVVARWTVREGEADRVEEAIRKLTPLSRDGESEHFQEYGFGTAIPRLERREREFYVTLDS
jgi:hypothetical protein